MRRGQLPFEAPTHLRSNQLALPPERLAEGIDDDEPATDKASGISAAAALEEYSKRVRTESKSMNPSGPDVEPYQTANRRRPRATPAPVLVARPATSPAQPLPPPPVVNHVAQPVHAHLQQRAAQGATSASASAPSASASAPSASKSRSASQPSASRSSSPARQASQPSASRSRQASQAAPQAAPQQQPIPAPPEQPPAMQQVSPGVGAFDPMQVPVPPELAPAIYSWVRRLALQADLQGADRVLRDALLDTSSSLSVTIVYPGADGLWTLGNEDEIPKDPSPLIAVAQARRAVIASHTALIPILTASEAVGVVMLTRNPRNPAYHPIEQIAMIALAREAGAIIHHLVIQHMQHQREVQMDKGSLYRGEALEAHRTRGTEGEVINLSPTWVKRCYPLLCFAVIIGLAASIMISVPTYSSGMGIIMYPSKTTSSPAAGTIESMKVKPGTEVKAGDIVATLNSDVERIELDNAVTEYDNVKYAFLFDQTDENARKSLAAAAARVEKAESVMATKVIRAKHSGVIGELKTKDGKGVTPGGPIVSIYEKNATPELIAFLPGSDLPRLKLKQVAQVELAGYKRARDMVQVTEVTREVIAGPDVERYVGEANMQALKLGAAGANYAVIKAKMPGYFTTEKTKRPFYHGMIAKVEVEVQNKPFLATLLPAIEKYLPE